MGPFSSKVVSSNGVVSVNQSQIDPNEGNLPEKLASQIEVFVKDENGNLYRLNSYEVAKFNIYKIDHGEDGDSAWLLSRREHRHSKLLKTDYKLSTNHITEEFENLCKFCENNKEKILETLIDKNSYLPTELGAKMIRTIDINDECVNKLYQAFSFLSNNVIWLDFGRMFNIGSVDGDANTIVAATVKSSIEGKIIVEDMPFGLGSLVKLTNAYDTTRKFELKQHPGGFLKKFLDSVFADCRIGLRDGNDSWTKIELLKFMSFWVFIAEKIGLKYIA